MDGFQELERPTLLVALTNRIDLLDTALLRPGRFEVQVCGGMSVEVEAGVGDRTTEMILMLPAGALCFSGWPRNGALLCSR